MEKEITLIDILFEFQKEWVKLKKTAENPFFKSSYIPLDAILDYLVPKLTEKNVLIYHSVVDWELQTTLRLVWTNQFIKSSFPLHNKDPQKQGSEITYGKRYNLSAIFNIQESPDDDWNKASSEWNTKEFYPEKQPEFWEENYKWFLTKKDNYKTAKEAIDAIKTVYSLSSHYEEIIKLLYK